MRQNHFIKSSLLVLTYALMTVLSPASQASSCKQVLSSYENLWETLTIQEIKKMAPPQIRWATTQSQMTASVDFFPLGKAQVFIEILRGDAYVKIHSLEVYNNARNKARDAWPLSLSSTELLKKKISDRLEYTQAALEGLFNLQADQLLFYEDDTEFTAAFNIKDHRGLRQLIDFIIGTFGYKNFLNEPEDISWQFPYRHHWSQNLVHDKKRFLTDRDPSYGFIFLTDIEQIFPQADLDKGIETFLKENQDKITIHNRSDAPNELDVDLKVSTSSHLYFTVTPKGIVIKRYQGAENPLYRASHLILDDVPGAKRDPLNTQSGEPLGAIFIPSFSAERYFFLISQMEF